MKKLLVANRGEIARRVFRTAKRMGIATVAVYSDADRDALFVREADEAVHLGASAPGESYLAIDKILAAAHATDADAIHPGYGFLSERAEFAEACRAANIMFVGPSPEAMRSLGPKVDAKALAVREGVPIVPGYFESGATDDDLRAATERIGYPVMLKASSGGGGRGMRVVEHPDEFDSALRLARAEALSAFGDDTMMVEKLVRKPRHVEVQVMADTHGNVAALFERECSIQRRHQKLIEESASPFIARHPEIWTQMSDAARRLCLGAGYTNAGTVEFIVDEAEGAFYFLEVNARLQVEHPVTELVTGLDLVEWQLRVARGEVLNLPEGLLRGDRAHHHGHAIEVRIIAEDPARNFAPSAGPILAWVEPRHPVRIDTGYGAGSVVPTHYDSMLAKVIAYGTDRPEAIARLREALRDFHIIGVTTNIAYILDVLDHPAFVAGEFDTGFLAREFGEWRAPDAPDAMGDIVAAVSETEPTRAWGRHDGFRNVPRMEA